MLRIFADENVHTEIINGLKRHGFDIITAIDKGLAGRRDIDILKIAEKEKCVLLTGDKDFGGLLEFGPLYGKGKVVLLRYTLIEPVKITADLITLLKMEERLIRKSKSLMIVVSENQYRIHLPKLR